MKHCFLFAICAALLVAVSGCASDQPTSGGSIAPSGSSNGSLGSGH